MDYCVVARAVGDDGFRLATYLYWGFGYGVNDDLCVTVPGHLGALRVVGLNVTSDGSWGVLVRQGVTDAILRGGPFWERIGFGVIERVGGKSAIGVDYVVNQRLVLVGFGDDNGVLLGSL